MKKIYFEDVTAIFIYITEVDRPGVACDQAGDGGLGDGAGQDDDLLAVEPGSESEMDT